MNKYTKKTSVEGSGSQLSGPAAKGTPPPQDGWDNGAERKRHGCGSNTPLAQREGPCGAP